MLRRTFFLGLASAAALAVAVSAGGAPSRSGAASFIGTWKVSPLPGTTAVLPWTNGGTLEIRSSSKGEVEGLGFRSTYSQPSCFEVPGSSEPDPQVAGWYVAEYSWSGGGTLGGCVSNKTKGSLVAHRAQVAMQFAQDAGGRYGGCWGDGNACLGFLATREAEGTTKTVNEPAPGKSTFIESPELPGEFSDFCASNGRALSASAKVQTCKVDVSSSNGDVLTEKRIVTGEGTVEQLTAGHFLFFCWVQALGNSNASPAVALSACVHMLIHMIIAGQFTVSKPALSKRSTAVAEVPGASAAGGCRSTPLAIGVRKGKGRLKFIVTGRVRNAKLRASSVRYSCSGSGGAATIKITAPGGIRNALGKRLNLSVYRAPKATRRSGKLTFTFGW